MAASPRDPQDLDFLTELLFSTQTLESLLDGLLRLAITEIAADGATITLAQDHTYQTSASTDEKSREIDLFQYQQGDGPCLRAIRTREITPADFHNGEEWGALAEYARSRGVMKAIAAPLVAGESTVGSINLYSHSQRGFEDPPIDLLRLITEVTAIFLRNFQLFDQRGELIDQLYHALESRSTIDMAKGKLMERHGEGADAAFARLKEESQRRNVKLRDVAEEISRSD